MARRWCGERDRRAAAAADYDGVSRDTVQRAGFTAACTTTRDVVRRGVDAWQLPRFAAQDRDGDWLGRMLERHEAGW